MKGLHKINKLKKSTMDNQFFTYGPENASHLGEDNRLAWHINCQVFL